MKKILALVFLIITTFLYGQDTIRTISGEEIIAKVMEIKKEEIKYKKNSNINGPTYLLSKTEIISITYLNGETEIFDNSKIEENPDREIEDTQLFEELTKKTIQFILTQKMQMQLSMQQMRLEYGDIG